MVPLDEPRPAQDQTALELTVLGTFLSFLSKPSALRSGLVAVLLLAGAVLFLNRAGENAKHVNTDSGRTDQNAYINYAEWLVESHYTYVGARNRMPVYAYMLSATRDLKETDAEFFEKAKGYNILFALAAVAVIGAIFLRSFPLHHALNLLLFSAFFVFLFRAAYVQAEVAYYLFSFLAFVVLWKLFTKPSWWWAVAGGALLGVSHLTKASVLPGVAVFGVFYLADILWCMVRTKKVGLGLKRCVIAALVIGAFLTTVFPYIKKSKEIYGHYFYNVNSTFYFWCDSWEEAKERTRAGGDRSGWPDLPADQIPSAKNYLRTHTPDQIAHRILSGAQDLNSIMARSYGYYPLVIIYTAGTFFLILWRRRLCWRLFVRRPMPILALLALFGGYFLLAAWYTQIISGNRIILSLFLPFIFTLAATLVFLGRKQTIRAGAWRLPILPLFNIAVSCYLVVDIILICSDRILRIYGGS